MRFPSQRECYHYITLLTLLPVFVGSLTGCEGTIASSSSTPMQLTSAASDYVSALGHFAITFDHPWQMGQSNSLDVSALKIDRPLLLAVELTPQFAEGPISQKPLVLDGTQVAGNLEEITGHLVLYRVDPDVADARITVPAAVFDSTWYDIGQELLGWELRIVLTSQIDAYPVHGGKSLEKRHSITAEDVQHARQTWIESEAGSRSPVGPPTDAHLIVPDSDSGVFLYYPVSMIVDSLTLSSGLAFDFDL